MPRIHVSVVLALALGLGASTAAAQQPASAADTARSDWSSGLVRRPSARAVRPPAPAAPATPAPGAPAASASAPASPPSNRPSDWSTGLVRNPPALSAEDAAMRARAFRAEGRRIVVSLAERRLWYMDGHDTLFTTPVAVGKGTRLEYGSRAWQFNTPRGIRRVQDKRPNPVWTPPEWHYAELAHDSGWALRHLDRGAPVRLRDGGRLLVRGDRIVYQHAAGGEEIIPEDEEIIFDNTLFVPPTDTRNRKIEGELGKYALSLGGGYLLHGTPHLESIGQAATHGCIRLGDEAIEYLYNAVEVGTPVYIF